MIDCGRIVVNLPLPYASRCHGSSSPPLIRKGFASSSPMHMWRTCCTAAHELRQPGLQCAVPDLRCMPGTVDHCWSVCLCGASYHPLYLVGSLTFTSMSTDALCWLLLRDLYGGPKATAASQAGGGALWEVDRGVSVCVKTCHVVCVCVCGVAWDPVNAHENTTTLLPLPMMLRTQTPRHILLCTVCGRRIGAESAHGAGPCPRSAGATAA